MKIETTRLYIRTLYETDWQEMQKIFIDFQHSQYAVYDMPLPVEEEAVKELTGKFAESRLYYAIIEKESSDMVGYVCFHKDGDSYDLGYCFHSNYHSKGYAFESIKALMEYFVNSCGAVGFTAGTALDNIPSCRLLEKLGFVCVATETVSFDPAFSFRGGNFVWNHDLNQGRKRPDGHP